MWSFFKTLRSRLKEQSEAKRFESGTICGKQGAEGEPPPANLHLSKPNTTIVASHSGPDSGIAVYKQFAPDLPATWDNPVDWAYGISVSMYDLGPTGRRNGEPVADCFGILAYPEGALLAVADGVNWGEPPRRAARCAVLGALSHMHTALRSHEGDSHLDSNTVFRHLVDSISAAQKLILQQFGTLTTLVVSAVLPLKWVRSPGRWAAVTLTVGDSAAYVYRAASREVEEVTAAAHAEGARDPRWCPGALGYAMGEEPDLSNMLLALTFLDEGDYIFLTSDGVADNFDPVIRKLARHQVFESADSELPALSPSECQAKAMELLRDVLVEADERLAGSCKGGAGGGSGGGGAGLADRAAGSGSAGSGANGEAAGGADAADAPAAPCDDGGGGGGGEASSANGHSSAPPSSAHRSASHSHSLLSHARPAGRGRGMTARGLAEQLLQHVYDVTQEQRAHVEARSRERERDRAMLAGSLGLGGSGGGSSGGGGGGGSLSSGISASGPSLGTDNKGLMGLAPMARPPGKMDHATVAAYQVGRRKPSAVAKQRLRPAPEGPPLPFLAAQGPTPNTTAPTSTAGGGGGGGGAAAAAASAQQQQQLEGPSRSGGSGSVGSGGGGGGGGGGGSTPGDAAAGLTVATGAPAAAVVGVDGWDTPRR